MFSSLLTEWQRHIWPLGDWVYLPDTGPLSPLRPAEVIRLGVHAIIAMCGDISVTTLGNPVS